MTSPAWRLESVKLLGALVTDRSTKHNPLHDLATQVPDGELCPVPAALATTPAGCLLDTLGITLTHVGVGRARAEMVVTPVHLNQRGAPQGGALVAFADAVAGWASDAGLAGGADFTTLEVKCNLLGRAELGATLVAVASPVHMGRRTLVHDVDVFRAEHESSPHPRRLVARFSCTQLVLSAH
jgi:1,4-dihydroxy-2-naphthoyl-CoA hydrolase